MKKNSWSIKGTAFLFLCFMLLSGCASLSATKSNNFVSKGKVLIMPPHDVVQGGEAHREGKDSGKQLQDSIELELELTSSFDIVAYEANDRFNFIRSIKIEEAIVEAKKMGADYCLILALGEFLDAAPFTFRPDFVNLERGVLVDVQTKEEVWSLDEPFMLADSDEGNYRTLIDKIAVMVAQSITK